MNQPSKATHSLRKEVYELLFSPETGETHDPKHWIRVGIAVLIFVNVVIVILETVEEIHATCHQLFYVIEVFSITIFSVEYLLHLWAIVEDPKLSHPFRGRVRYFFTFFALVDLFAILSFFLPHLINANLLIMRALRLFRLVRVLKLGHYSTSFGMIGEVFKSKRGEIFSSIFVLVIIFITCSSMMYFIEHEAQPAAFPNIPTALWSSLTTLGYGETYPITPIGKAFAAICAILSIGIVALPSGIIMTGFVEKMHKKEALLCQCPNCKKEVVFLLPKDYGE